MDKKVLQSVRAALPAAVALILIFTLFAPVKAGVSPEVGRGLIPVRSRSWLRGSTKLKVLLQMLQ
ncbi:hypothetical protein B6V00_03225 [ANME-1 cluster archaeon ex4572_4]|nr:MAG: hypothetical protein B6V00_03225 [ANME-1 cluster archaeon ex4572_4]